MTSRRRFRRTIHGRTIKLPSDAEKPIDQFLEPVMVEDWLLADARRCNNVGNDLLGFETSRDSFAKISKQNVISDKALQYVDDKFTDFDDYSLIIEDDSGARVENPPKDKPVELMVPKVRSQPIRSLLPSFDQSLQCDSAVQQHRESIPDSAKNDETESKISFGRPSTRRVLDILFEKEDTVEPKKSRNENSILQRGSSEKKAANITQKPFHSLSTAEPHTAAC
uniref:Breast cancer susceptibility 1 n=1 Tax=Panagrolaimus davidi TaxID=227884 RepID=A0A914P449_9BILA